MILISSLLHKHRSCRYWLDFDENLASIFNMVVCLAGVVQSPQACLHFLLEYTRIFSSQSREGGHPSTPWIIINNPFPQEVGLPFHRAPFKLKMTPPPFKNASPFWEMISRKKSKYSKLLLISVVQIFYLLFGCLMTNFGSLLKKHLIHPILSPLLTPKKKGVEPNVFYTCGKTWLLRLLLLEETGMLYVIYWIIRIPG